MRRILVPTDFSDPAANALRYASSLAARSGASLLILHVDPFAPTVAEARTGQIAVARRQQVEVARMRLAAHVRAVVNPLVSYDIQVVADNPVEAIVQASGSDVDLVVMGTHGHSGMTRVIFGSVTAEVMRLASAPVLAVNRDGGRDPHIRRIACPVTFTYPWQEALRCAAALSAAPIVLLRTVADDPIRLHDCIPAEVLDRCSISVIPAHASAGDIVGFARLNDIDLIAIDVPPDRKVMEVLQGTIAEKIVESSGCPVLTVNARAAESIAFSEVARELTPA